VTARALGARRRPQLGLGSLGHDHDFANSAQLLDDLAALGFDAFLDARVVDWEIERKHDGVAVDADSLDAVLRHDAAHPVDVDDGFERGANGVLCDHDALEL
jgi:hypothetical protein